MAPTCASVMLVTHWALMKSPALVRPLRVWTSLTRFHWIRVDINECGEEIDGCAQNCTNTIGSYTCSCNPGFVIDTDRRSCNGKRVIKKIKDNE